MYRRFIQSKFQRIFNWCTTYVDIFSPLHTTDVKSLFMKPVHALRKALQNKNYKGIRKRIPLFSFGLLFILFALNIGFSVGQTVLAVTHTTQTTTQATQSTTSQDTSSTNQQATRIKVIDLSPDQIKQICALNPVETTKTVAQIMAYAAIYSDKAEDIYNYMLTGGTGQNNNPIATSTVDPNSPNPTDPQVEQICEETFSSQGVETTNDDILFADLVTGVSQNNTNFNINCGTASLTRTPSAAFPVYYDNKLQAICLQTLGPNNWVFPCSDASGGPEYTFIKSDWLSGDIESTNPESGHFEQTPVSEPILFPAMQAIGLAILAPIIILTGMQLAAGFSSFRLANAIESLSRVILGVVLVFVCYEAIQILIGISNALCQAVVTFHGAVPYPQPVTYPITGSTEKLDFGYTLGTESQTDPSSYRGIIVPISRWGCTANDFVKILAVKLATDIAGMLPFVGGFIKFAGTIHSAIEVMKYAGEFIKGILSIMLGIQILTRLVILNFYIMLAPVAFACWGLPGGVGSNIVRSWLKGFVSVLAVQFVQVFMITVIPLLIPTTLPTFPQDSLHILDSFIHELPSIAILLAVVRVPKMLGTSATNMIASAGQVAGGAVVAVGVAAYNIV